MSGSFWRKIHDLLSPPEKSESSEQDKPPAKPDPDALYKLATALFADYEQMAQPNDLLARANFKRGVDILRHPGFTEADLIQYAAGDNEVIGHMALTALSLRPADERLCQELLACFPRVSPWRQYFCLMALQKHAPASKPIIGQLVFLNRQREPQFQGIFLAISQELLADRLHQGEKPAFGSLLDDMELEQAEQLKKVLGEVNAPGLAPLTEELERWRLTHIDKDLLRGAGQIWGEAPAGRTALVIEHPKLDAHVAELLKLLEQDQPRSAIVVGDQGVGKSAVIQSLKRKLQDKGWFVFEASGADLIAGQKYHGELEERLRKITAQLGGKQKTLWYAPDFVSLHWAGKHEHSRHSALDYLLPHIETGQLLLLGEARLAAFERLIQTQPRIMKAFELCRIEPLSENRTQSLGREWATAHTPASGQPLMTDEVMQEAWLLAQQYLQDRAAPGNLLEFLELTHQRLAADAPAAVSIESDDLILTLAKLTGLPTRILDDRQILDREDLRAFFNQRILGQPEAVDCLVERVTMIKAGLADPTRPQGVFLFAGPTGTGKTEIAKALATYLFGSAGRLVRLDMSEYQTPESLERLLGNQPGEQGQSLAARIRKQPFSVVLLDEIEKAAPRIWDVFLQVFDDGRLTDQQGNTADFRHAIIIMTSNLGSRIAGEAGLGFDKKQEGFRASDVSRAIEQAFSKEFLNRLDRVIVFRPFTREIMRHILAKELREVQQRRGLRHRDWEVVWEDSALEFLLERGFSGDLGARPLKRAIDRYLLAPLATAIVNREIPEGNQFLYVQTDDDKLAVQFIDPNAPDEEPAVDAPLAEETTAAQRPLPAIVLNPQGRPVEIDSLLLLLEEQEDFLASDGWREQKEIALSMMSLPDFWGSPERFTILGEVEYRDRIESGSSTARMLLDRLVYSPEGRREQYPRKLVGQVAQQLYLIGRACQALTRQQPWEAFVLVDCGAEPGPEPAQASIFAEKLGAMYCQWARKRQMQWKVLEERRKDSKRSYHILLAVSGYAAYSMLALEQGLHVWEILRPDKPKSFKHCQIHVRVLPQPDKPIEERKADLLAVAKRTFANQAAGTPAVVRTYREAPAPLVRDRVQGWRTGRLDRVFAGDFDLIGHEDAGAASGAEDRAAES